MVKERVFGSRGREKEKGGEYWEYAPPGKRLGKTQLTKRVYCYCKWMFVSRRFSRRERGLSGPGLLVVPGVEGGFGGTGMWRRFSMVLEKLSCYVGIVVRIVRLSFGFGPKSTFLVFKHPF
jgi:hypothetical protein